MRFSCQKTCHSNRSSWINAENLLQLIIRAAISVQTKKSRGKAQKNDYLIRHEQLFGMNLRNNING
jgi:hypothetical protein